MRSLCRWLLSTCGIALICLRLYPADQEWVSNLFHDDFIYARANEFSVHLIKDSGLSLSLYEQHADNLTSLTKTTVIILEAAAIGLFFLILNRKLR
jgi:hypothetical protein